MSNREREKMDNLLLEVKDLKTYFYDENRRRFLRVVDGVSFDIKRGETVALFGESGSGKTRIAYSIMGLVPHTPGIIDGEIWFEGENLLKGLREICYIEDGNSSLKIKKDVHKWIKQFKYEEKMKKIRGRKISLVMQGARSALNPFQIVRKQIEEVYLLNNNKNKSIMNQEINKMLTKLHIRGKADEFPHNLSGGMCQRVVIAIALAAYPKLLIADEPTTGIDPPLMIKIIELFKEFKETNTDSSLLLISHDLEAVKKLADRIVIICGGRVVESGKIDIVKSDEVAKHPYTKKLLQAHRSKAIDEDKLFFMPGIVPDPSSLIQGCKFYQRCEFKQDECAKIEPELLPVNEHHSVACPKWQNLEGTAD